MISRLARHLRTATAWRADAGLRRRIASIGHVLTGNLTGSVIGLLAVAVSARGLGPHDYGILALTITFVRAIENLVTFQSWQPMIRYGAGLDAESDKPALATLFKFGLMLDLMAGVAAWVVAMVSLLIAARWFAWNEATLHTVAVYCTVLLFNLSGMPIAVLRLAGRFRMAAYGQVAAAVIRLLLCLVALAADADLWTFVLIWAITQIFSSLTLLAVGFGQLRRQDIRNILQAPLRGVTSRFPGLWQFTWSANLSLTLRSSANKFDTLLVGALTGPSGAGLYHIAKQIGKMAQQVGTQVQVVLYPDITRLWAAGAVADFRRAVVQIEILLAAFGIAALIMVLLAGDWLLRVAAGADFAVAAPLLKVQMVAVVLMISGAAAHSALMAMGQARQVLGVVVVGTVAFHATLLLLVPQIGAMGANVAHIVMGLIWVCGLGWLLRRGLRVPPVIAAAGPGADLGAGTTLVRRMSS